MDLEDLERAKTLQGKIEELTRAIYFADEHEAAFYEKLVIERQTKIGFICKLKHLSSNTEVYELDKKLSKKVVSVLKEQLEEWKKELSKI